jgi:hypothetical protein
MGDFINRLRELNVAYDDFVNLSYTEGNEVWHCTDSYVQDSVVETDTASMLAGLLASGVPVFDKYSSEPGEDVLNSMRSNSALDDYDYEGWFAEYLTERLQETIYDGEYSLEYSTEQYDYKRGRCDISTEVRVRFGDLVAAEESNEFRFSHFSADSFVSGFEVSVETSNGVLTLN